MTEIADFARIVKTSSEQELRVAFHSARAIVEEHENLSAALTAAQQKIAELEAERIEQNKQLDELNDMARERRLRIDDLELALTAERQRRESTEAERDESHKYAHEITKALTGLVGGGSEMFAGRIGKGTSREMFKADLPFCLRRIQERLDIAHEELKAKIRTTRYSTASDSEERDG